MSRHVLEPNERFEVECEGDVITLKRVTLDTPLIINWVLNLMSESNSKSILEDMINRHYKGR